MLRLGTRSCRPGSADEIPSSGYHTIRLDQHLLVDYFWSRSGRLSRWQNPEPKQVSFTDLERAGNFVLDRRQALEKHRDSGCVVFGELGWCVRGHYQAKNTAIRPYSLSAARS